MAPERGAPGGVEGYLEAAFAAARDALGELEFDLVARETGSVESLGGGIARVRGLPGIGVDELVDFAGGATGFAIDLDADSMSVALLNGADRIVAGGSARRRGRAVSVPVGRRLLGRVVDPLGRPLDDGEPIDGPPFSPIERSAPPIVDRAPVRVPLQTGLLAVDALVPIGRGQRQLIIGDRQIGKTAIAVDAIANQGGKGLVCVYCAIGQRKTAVAKVVEELRDSGAMEYSFVVVASGDDAPGMNFIAPYAATAMAEYFTERGGDALVVYDDLSRHARSYRELSLLLRRPPAREAYPGDIFYIHSRLLERATRLRPERGGGSLTALPIVETEAQNIAAYIPTNLVSITDGQIYLSPKLFREGALPAIDVGKSVSRVGGNAQLPAYREVAGSAKLDFAQYEELETFERFSARLEESTRAAIERGRRIREILKQGRLRPLAVIDQLSLLLAATRGRLDARSIAQARALADALAGTAPKPGGDPAIDLAELVASGAMLGASDEDRLLARIESLAAAANGS